MNAPAGKSELVSLELVEFNSSVTLSQLYAVLGKVAKEVGKVYEKSGDETLAQLAQGYYTMEEEAKGLSKLVEKQLQEYNKKILRSSCYPDDAGSIWNCVNCLVWIAINAALDPNMYSLCRVRHRHNLGVVVSRSMHCHMWILHRIVGSCCIGLLSVRRIHGVDRLSICVIATFSAKPNSLFLFT